MIEQTEETGTQESASMKVRSSIVSRNFGLKEAEFEAMLRKLMAGDELLFEQVFLSQFEETMTYLKQNYKISHAQAYDASMDALLKFRKRLLAGKISYGNMRFLFTRMAGQFLYDAGKHKMGFLDDSQKEIADSDELDDDMLDLLDKAWVHLCEDCSQLLNEFYFKKVALKTVATQLNKSEAAIRKQKQRCLEKLRNYFIKYYKA